METSEKDKITPERAMEILKKDGLEVSLEQANLILKFLSAIADIAIDQHMKKRF